jgi:hypothetical protein
VLNKDTVQVIFKNPIETAAGVKADKLQMLNDTLYPSQSFIDF